MTLSVTERYSVAYITLIRKYLRLLRCIDTGINITMLHLMFLVLVYSE